MLKFIWKQPCERSNHIQVLKWLLHSRTKKKEPFALGGEGITCQYTIIMFCVRAQIHKVRKWVSSPRWSVMKSSLHSIENNIFGWLLIACAIVWMIFCLQWIFFFLRSLLYVFHTFFWNLKDEKTRKTSKLLIRVP